MFTLSYSELTGCEKLGSHDNSVNQSDFCNDHTVFTFAFITVQNAPNQHLAMHILVKFHSKHKDALCEQYTCKLNGLKIILHAC